MKSILKIGVPIVLLMAAVLGISYIAQSTGGQSKLATIPPGPPPGPDGKAVGDPVIFPSKISIWRKDLVETETISAEEDRTKYTKQVEILSDNHYDFSFFNPQENEVQLSLRYQSCTCSNVEYAVFRPEDWTAYQQERALAGMLTTGAGPDLTSVVAAAKLYKGLEFQPLPDAAGDHRGLVPGAKGGIPHPGIVRVKFKPKKLSLEAGGEAIKVTVNSQIPFGAFASHDLMIHYETVGPLGVLPPSIDIAELTAGQRRTVEVLVWSTTREKFTPFFEVLGPDAADKDDRCIEIGTPIPLNEKEMAEFPKALGKQYEKMRPVCAYRVPVTIHESFGGKQLDLGPFLRRLMINLESGNDSLRVPITGIVRGDIRVLSGDDRDRVPLGTFKSDRGAKRTVTLVSSNLNLDLEVVRTTDAALKAQLGPPKVSDGQKQWSLTVEMPPDQSAGELTATSAIILQTKGPNPRKMRVPVTGNSTR